MIVVEGGGNDILGFGVFRPQLLPLSLSRPAMVGREPIRAEPSEALLQVLRELSSSCRHDNSQSFELYPFFATVHPDTLIPDCVHSCKLCQARNIWQWLLLKSCFVL